MSYNMIIVLLKYNVKTYPRVPHFIALYFCYDGTLSVFVVVSFQYWY